MEWESTSCSIHNEEFGDLKLDLLGAALNRLLWLNNLASDINNALSWNIAHILDHLFGGCLTFEGNGLDSSKGFSQDNESAISLCSNVVDSGSYQNLFAFEGLIDILHRSPNSLRSKSGLNERIVSKGVSLPINGFNWVLRLHLC